MKSESEVTTSLAVFTTALIVFVLCDVYISVFVFIKLLKSGNFWDVLTSLVRVTPVAAAVEEFLSLSRINEMIGFLFIVSFVVMTLTAFTKDLTEEK